MPRILALVVLLAATRALAAEVPPAGSRVDCVEPLAPASPAPAPPADWSQLRVDVEDGLALHPWLYHEVRLDERWGILGTLQASLPGLNPGSPPFLELDVGPVLHLGALQINPQLGIDAIWDAAGGKTRFADLIAQLYLVWPADRFNLESWHLVFFPLDGADVFYQSRQLATVRVAGALSVGPHVEWTFVSGGPGFVRRAFGGDVAWAFRWGTLTMFLANESVRKAPELRLTFTREL